VTALKLAREAYITFAVTPYISARSMI